MAGYLFVQSELLQESWEARLTRVSIEMRDLIAASRKVIAQSRAAIHEADRLLAIDLPNKQGRARPSTVN